MYLAFIVLDSLGVESGKIRGAVLLLIILYEPVLVSLNKTIGHQIMGLRVFNYNVLVRSNEKTAISLMNSILRYIGKVILGWISLLTVHSDKYGQAIHDKIGRSVMVME